MRAPSPETPDVDEWDPQGLNQFDKVVLESFSSDEEEVAPEAVQAEPRDPADEPVSDGLRELEEMERTLLAAEPTLDFALVGEEE